LTSILNDSQNTVPAAKYTRVVKSKACTVPAVTAAAIGPDRRLYGTPLLSEYIPTFTFPFTIPSVDILVIMPLTDIVYF
jgi:hypothetical protein